MNLLINIKIQMDKQIKETEIAIRKVDIFITKAVA
jgi:hypothetical protein